MKRLKRHLFLNVKVEDWANGADALSDSINRDQMVADVAENILNNIKR